MKDGDVQPVPVPEPVREVAPQHQRSRVQSPCPPVGQPCDAQEATEFEKECRSSRKNHPAQEEGYSDWMPATLEKKSCLVLSLPFSLHIFVPAFHAILVTWQLAEDQKQATGRKTWCTASALVYCVFPRHSCTVPEIRCAARGNVPGALQFCVGRKKTGNMQAAPLISS